MFVSHSQDNSKNLEFLPFLLCTALISLFCVMLPVASTHGGTYLSTDLPRQKIKPHPLKCFSKSSLIQSDNQWSLRTGFVITVQTIFMRIQWVFDVILWKNEPMCWAEFIKYSWILGFLIWLHFSYNSLIIEYTICFAHHCVQQNNLKIKSYLQE